MSYAVRLPYYLPTGIRAQCANDRLLIFSRTTRVDVLQNSRVSRHAQEATHVIRVFIDTDAAVACYPRCIVEHGDMEHAFRKYALVLGMTMCGTVISHLPPRTRSTKLPFRRPFETTSPIGPRDY